MSTLPDFTGPGFFAGEAPDGLTTIAGTPTSASVRVYWRDPADPDAPDVLVAQTTSAPDGTWRITGLNPDLRYVVRAQKSNFDDATVVGAQPSRTDVITYVDYLEPTEGFDGLIGYVLLDSGLTPFTCEVIDPLPYGLSARVEGRKLLIEGKSTDDGQWSSVVRVTASNGVWVDVPVAVEVETGYDGLLSLLNPVSWWRLDEASGTVALDARGYKNGVYQGNPSLRSAPLRKGSYGSAGFLSGAQQCLVGADSFFGGLFGKGRSSTIMFWFRNHASNGQNRLIQYFDGVRSRGPWRMWRYAFEVPSENRCLDLLSTDLFDGEIHFLVVTKGEAGYALYVDGVLKESNPATGGAEMTGGYGLCFPAAGGYGHYPRRCYLSDVAVFDYALSDKEVARLYSAGRLAQ